MLHLVRRQLYFLLAWCFFLLGLLGAFLPVLPTTPFMLLALWAFARSSPRFHAWLYGHRIFGPPLRQWQQHRAIALRVKLLSSTVMLISAVLMLSRPSIPGWALTLALLLMGYGAWFIWTKPSLPASKGEISE